MRLRAPCLKPEAAGRHHPHLPEVRSPEHPQPHAAAARPGLRGLRAHAGLRRHARTDRRGAGPRRPPRSQPDRRPGPEPGSADGDAPRAEAEDPGTPTRPAACRRRPPAHSTSSAAQMSRRRPWPKRFQQAVARRAAPRPGAALVPRRGTSAAASPGSWCSWSTALGDKYQVDELAAKYEFTGRTPMTIPQALEIKEELEDDRPAAEAVGRGGQDGPDRRHRPGELAEFAEPGDIEQLNQLARQIEQYLRDLAERQGLEKTGQGYQLTPKAYRLFQGRLLERIFSELQAVADRPPPGAGGRRRGRRDAADQALRVRRLAGQHGHPRLAHQRHDPQRAGPARADAARGHRRSIAPATRPSAPPRCCWT